jgi:hypothetical protein
MALNLFGSLFHVVSLIYLPVYFFLDKHYSRKIILIFFIVGNIVFFLSTEWIKGIIFFFSNLVDSRLSILIVKYLEHEGFSAVRGISIGYVERTITFFIMFVFYDKLIRESESSIIFFNILLLYMFSYLYGAELEIIVQRGGVLFCCSYWILYPRLYDIFSKEKKKLFLALLIFYGILRIGTDSTTPVQRYENILFNHSTFYQRESLLFNFYSSL